MSFSASPAVDKEEDRLTGLIQSQQWPDGFGPSGEIFVWDQGNESFEI